MKNQSLSQIAKDWIGVAVVVFTTVLLTVFLCGCQTAPGGKTDFGPLVDSAAYTGTVVYLTKHPDQRPAFVTAESALGVLSTSETIGFADLQAAFRPILGENIRELRDIRTQLLVDNAVILVDAYAGRLDTSTASMDQLRMIARAARNGIARALVVTAPEATR